MQRPIKEPSSGPAVEAPSPRRDLGREADAQDAMLPGPDAKLAQGVRYHLRVVYGFFLIQSDTVYNRTSYFDDSTPQLRGT